MEKLVSRKYKCIPTVKHGPGFQKKKELSKTKDNQNRKLNKQSKLGLVCFVLKTMKAKLESISLGHVREGEGWRVLKAFAELFTKLDHTVGRNTGYTLSLD